MTQSQQLLTIAVIAMGTMLTRFLPFLIFPDGKEAPPVIEKLGNLLPGAVFSFLVVCCLKNVNPLSGSHGIPEAIAIAAITAVHIWKRNTLLSIATGTIVYMALVQTIF